MKSVVLRVCFVVFFTIGFCGLSFIALMLAISTGLGPPHAGDLPITNMHAFLSRMGSALLAVMWFPISVLKKLFFMGRPLPGSDWFWIAGCGFLYSTAIVSIYDVVKRWKQNLRADLSSRG
jgi:hypothetical protein